MQNEIKLILATHLAFYRRHPWLMLLFILGFSLGSALLTAISGLNQEAKNRYQHSSALLNNPVSHLIKPLTGQYYIDGNLWLQLSKQGVINSQPVLRGRLTTEEGRTLAIQGVDTLLWLNNLQYNQREITTQKSKHQPNNTPSALSFTSLLVDTQFTARLYNKSAEPIPFIFDNNQLQPDFNFADDIGLWAITDLANADYLLNAKGQLSFIELSHVRPRHLQIIKELIADKAQLVDVDQQDFDVLSQAFFFNLTSLAMLGYIVAAFLSFNAIKLTLTARKKLIQQMQLLGCTKTHIQLSLCIELIIVSLGSALLGALGGYFIANGLVLDVNRTLVGMFQLDKALVIHWQWSNVWLGFLLNLSALIVILLAQSKQVAVKAQGLFYFCLTASVISLFWLLYSATSKLEALLLCFTILLIFILLVPKALSRIVAIRLKISSPLMQWLHADTRFHIKDLHIAIIAILVALGSAIGMQIMVKSFSETLNAHLEKQLSADIYLRSDKLDSSLRETLTNLAEVKQLSIYLQSEGRVKKITTSLVSFGENIQYYQHIALTSGEKVQNSHFAQQGCLANEQSQIKFGIKLGSLVDFKQNAKHFSCRISGFFYDYGNPSMMLLTLEQRHNSTTLFKDSYGYSIRLNPNTTLATFSERLVEEYGQDSTKIIPNKRFKQYANTLFNDTFIVTKALNGFILAIALLSLCTSLLSLSANQLKQLTILHNLGVKQQQILSLKMIQTTGIVFFTALFAIPLGFALGFALLSFVMPIAFGWTIHFSLDITSLFWTCFTLIAVAVLCAYLPIRKLTKSNVKGI